MLSLSVREGVVELELANKILCHPPGTGFKGPQHNVVVAGGNHSNQNSPQRMQAIQEGG